MKKFYIIKKFINFILIKYFFLNYKKKNNYIKNLNGIM